MRAELTIVAVLMSGCSVVTMERPSWSSRPEKTPRCTRNWRPIAGDALIVSSVAMNWLIFEQEGNERGRR